MKSNTRKFTLSLITASILAAPLAFADQTTSSSSVTEALANSKVNLNFRTRYESVEQNGKDNAAALTLRSRISVNTGAANNFSVGVEVDNVTSLVDGYNDLTNSYEGNEAVIADPEVTDINQAFVKYKNTDLSFTVGRQRINHNDQRFVGGVGWRQNEQTYDGARLQFNITDKLSLDYSLIQNVNRIFAADSKKADDLKGNFNLVNLAYQFSDDQKVTIYAYELDFDTAASMSTTTYGALYNAKMGGVDFKASYAIQKNNAANPIDFENNYFNLEGTFNLENAKLIAGYELLSSDNGVGFSTPLATLHKFNGFADMFLGTPSTGLQDAYFTAKTKVKGVAFSATYHKLFSDVDSIDYGTEVDVSAAYKFNNNYSALIKYSTFNADEYATDTNKLWLMLTAKF